MLRPYETIREVNVLGPDDNVYTGTLLRYFHHVPGDMHGNPAKWVESKCLRLAVPGLDEHGEQDRHNDKDFFFVGAGTFKLLN